MMDKPSLDELMEKVDSRYTLVSVAAKRARMINEAREKVKDNPRQFFSDVPLEGKTVTIALEEIDSGEITYIKNEVETDDIQLK